MDVFSPLMGPIRRGRLSAIVGKDQSGMEVEPRLETGSGRDSGETKGAQDWDSMTASQLWGSIEDLRCRYRKSGSISAFLEHHPSNRTVFFSSSPSYVGCRMSEYIACKGNSERRIHVERVLGFENHCDDYVRCLPRLTQSHTHCQVVLQKDMTWEPNVVYHRCLARFSVGSTPACLHASHPHPF